jgi:mannose-6-phosphate isomerase-like protein (cupin superfamily)
MEEIVDKHAVVEEKGWGREIIFAKSADYCGKFLVFDKRGDTGSLHCHKEKTETWFVLRGSFDIIRTNRDGRKIVSQLVPGDIWTNLPMDFHQLSALENDSVIVEVSTKDMESDTYRVEPGDSQR